MVRRRTRIITRKEYPAEEVVARVGRLEFTTYPMMKVSSSNVDKYGYNHIKRECYVDFLNGYKYTYFKVPFDVWEDFYYALSKGSFVHRRLKGKYEYRRDA